MDVRIVGSGLPGRSWGDPRPGGCRYDNIHVGIQRQREVVELVAGDAAEAQWDLSVQVRHPDGEVDFGGPFVQGRRGERFVYLSWGTVDDGGAFEMFRRAKLLLAPVDAGMVEAADAPGHRLLARLGLTGGDGGPRCASVRPPVVTWSAEPVGSGAGVG